MAKYSRADGVYGIVGDDGYGWKPADDGTWTRDDWDGPVYALEKRRRNPKDGCMDAGWYLYDDQPGGFFGEWCSTRILDAVDIANAMISKAEDA